MLVLQDTTFEPNIDLMLPLPDSDVMSESMKYFDKDGYELNQLEQLYYTVNNVDIGVGNQYHTSNQIPWINDIHDYEVGAVLDHSFMSQRWEYSDDAKDQLTKFKDERPILNKLLGIRKKWGIDFSIDFVDHNNCFEIFHIEYDSFDFENILMMKEKAENIILNTDWYDGAKEVLRRKDEWIGLCSDDQSDWKAQFFGWHRAFDNQKIIL